MLRAEKVVRKSRCRNCTRSKGHPFKVKDDEAMMETADSIKQYGVLVPAIARPDPEGGYELVAGHRRHRASELAEKETMPVIVRDLDDDAATIIMKILKCLLMIVTAPVILVLTLFVWLCTGLIYISGLVLGLLSTVIALLGVAVLITYSPQNGVILLVMAFLISPMGLPLAAIWLLGKVQSLKFAIQDWVYG